MILKRWTPGTTAMLTVAMLLVLTGCATMVATSGISGLHEIPTDLSRKEVQERYGSPASSGATAAGRRTESFNIRQRLVDHKSVSSAYGSATRKSWDDFKLACILFPPGCAAIWIGGSFIAAEVEVINFPIILARSEKNKLEVAFVYGPDDRILYFYEPKLSSIVRYGQALRTLPHPLSSETELAKCPSAKECTERYAEELQRRAVEIGYTPTVTEGETLLKDIKLAKDLDDGKITKEELFKLGTDELDELLKLRNGS